MSFIVYGLPRSRTFWLSRFLSYRDWHCGHDEMRYARSMADVDAWFSQPTTGTVETAAAPWWRLVAKYEPRVVVVRRPVAEVFSSAAAAGGIPDMRYLTYLNRKLDQIEARVPSVLSVQYSDLVHEATCAAVFEHCLPYSHDHGWWSYADKVNAQTNLPAIVRYMTAYGLQLQKLSKIAKHMTIASMNRRISAEMDGMEMQVEPFEVFFRDGQKLFAEHLVQVGEAPDNFLNKNLSLMSLLDKIGALQVVTARSNGRMFGYLMSVISPSLEENDKLCGVQTTFFASPDAPRGLGMKLQRFSIESMRQRGVHEVLFRAGVRGDGPRMAPLYKRLGAEDYGQYFSLDLKAA